MSCRTDIFFLQLGFVILVMVNVCAPQTPFQVNNPKQQDWPQEEANLIYFSVARNLAAEFTRPQLPITSFSRALAAIESSVDMNRRELRLKKWDKCFYAEGVLRLTFAQMLSAESKMRLARRA